METNRYRVSCDGVLEDSSPCTQVAEGELVSATSPIPVPDGWIRMHGIVEVHGSGGTTSQPNDLNFHSAECEQGYHDGPFRLFRDGALN